MGQLAGHKSSMITIWELDFYSRPILDENNKKLWEVVICESPLTVNTQPDSLFRYAEYCTSNEINSVRLKQVIHTAISRAPQPPSKIRFFRQAMTNMITRACDEVGLPAVLSRRTYTLNHWLEQRMATVYPQEPGFQPGTSPSVPIAKTAPQPLPDALLGQKWAFVDLEAAAFADMGSWAIAFGEAFPLSLAQLPPQAKIPGLLIFSERATPLAAWMSGLELAAVSVDNESSRLLLETGVSDRWILATLNRPTLQAEARTFQGAKQAAYGVHFIAIQASPEVEEFAGFWLLMD
jgi:hypothetical protein